MRNHGRGPPKKKIGLVSVCELCANDKLTSLQVGTTYRPSGAHLPLLLVYLSEMIYTLDDVVIFPYNIPHQAMLVAELRGLVDLLAKLGVRPDLMNRSRSLAASVEAAIWKYGVVDTPDFGRVFAYEVDGKLRSHSNLMSCHHAV